MENGSSDVDEGTGYREEDEDSKRRVGGVI